MYSVLMNGSLTATSSTSSLCRATLATNRPILPNPEAKHQTNKHTDFFTFFRCKKNNNKKNKMNRKRKLESIYTVDSNLDLPHGGGLKLLERWKLKSLERESELKNVIESETGEVEKGFGVYKERLLGVRCEGHVTSAVLLFSFLFFLFLMSWWKRKKITTVQIPPWKCRSIFEKNNAVQIIWLFYFKITKIRLDWSYF